MLSLLSVVAMWRGNTLVELVSGKSCHNLVAVRVVLSYEAGYNLQDSIMSFIEVTHAQGLGAMVENVSVSLHKVGKHWKGVYSSSVQPDWHCEVKYLQLRLGRT